RAASTGSMSPAVFITHVVARIGNRLRSELVDQSAHAHATLDRLIVREREQRGPAQVQLLRNARLQDTLRPLERRERAFPPPARRIRPRTVRPSVERGGWCY